MQAMSSFNEHNTNRDSGLILDNSALEQLNLCKRIRRLAALDSIRLDATQHASGLNLHLINYLKYNKLDPLEYIKSYLMKLQPFMIERFPQQEKFGGALCILDNAYRISVYIKLDTTEHEELIVSFHENSKAGLAPVNSMKKNNYFVQIIPDCIISKAESQDKVSYVVKLIMQRGLLGIGLNVPAEKEIVNGKEVFLARYSYVEVGIIGLCNQYLTDIYVSDLNLDINDIELFARLEEVSFTSYSHDSFSTLSLLIDSYYKQTGIGRRAADFAISTYANNLSLTQQQKDELLGLLREKFAVEQGNKVNLLIERIEDSLINVLE